MPIVEPEVLIDGGHGIERSEAAAARVLQACSPHSESEMPWLPHLGPTAPQWAPGRMPAARITNAQRVSTGQRGTGRVLQAFAAGLQPTI